MTKNLAPARARGPAPGPFCVALAVAIAIVNLALPITATAQDVGVAVSPIGDTAGRFSLEAPAAWGNVTEAGWTIDGNVVGTQVTATPDLAAFNTDWGTPGVVVSYSEVLPGTTALSQVLDQVDLAGACRDGGRQPYTTEKLAGYVQRWEDCGGTATTGTVAALAPIANPDYYVVLEIYTTDPAEQSAIERILTSFAPLSRTAPAQDEPATTEVQPGPTGSTTAADAPPSRPGLAYTYASRRDPAVVALLPEEYGDLVSEPWIATTGEPIGFMLAAGPSLAAFRTTWTTPGIVVRTALSLTRKLDAADLLADSDLLAACTTIERDERVHATPIFTYDVLLDTYSGCGGASSYTLAVAQSNPTDHLIFLEFQAIDAADRAALDIFLDSFAVDRAAAAGTAAISAEPTDETAGETAEVLPTPAPTPTPVLPTGVVLANNLNVRSGPGTEFERLGAAPRGTVLPVAGQLGNCAWLRITAPTNLEGWVSGDAEFITLDTPCSAIPAVQP